MKNFNYHASQLEKLNIKKDDLYFPLLKIEDNKGNKTHYLSITFEQYEQIKNILINQ